MLIVLHIFQCFLFAMFYWNGQIFYFTTNLVKSIFNWLILIGTVFQKAEVCLIRSQRQLQFLLELSLDLGGSCVSHPHQHTEAAGGLWIRLLWEFGGFIKLDHIIKLIIFSIYKCFHSILMALGSFKHFCKSIIIISILQRGKMKRKKVKRFP